MAEKIIAGFGLIFVTSYVARYIGPSLFGKLTLAAAIFQVAQIVAQMGSDNIIFKRLARNTGSGINLIRATTNLRIACYTVLATPTLLFFVYGEDFTTSIFFLATCLASLFTAWDAYLVYNNALLKARVNAVANVIGLAAGLSLRYVVAKLQLAPEFLSIPIIATTLIPLCIRAQLFRKEAAAINRPRSGVKHIRYLLMAGGSVVVASISIAFYTRIGQFMLSALKTEKDLGVYAAALTIATSWSFVSAAVTNSFFPAIYAEKNEDAALAKAANLGRFTLLLCIAATAFFAAFGNWIVSTLYGAEYSGAYIPGIILCASVSLSALGSIAYRYIIRHSGYSYLSRKMLIVVILSPLVYAPLISSFGLTGAALGVLVIEALSLTAFNYLFKGGIIFRLHKKTFFA